MIVSSNIMKLGLMVGNLNLDDYDCIEELLTPGGYLRQMHNLCGFL